MEYRNKTIKECPCDCHKFEQGVPVFDGEITWCDHCMDGKIT